MRDIWKPKHKVWFKKNDDSKLGKREDMPDDVKEYEKETKRERKRMRAYEGGIHFNS